MINSIGSTGGSLAGIAGQSATTRGEAVARTKGPTAAAEDKAAVSTTISQLASGGAPIDGDRVAALREAIKSGTYKADPTAIASAMISSDLGTSL